MMHPGAVFAKRIMEFAGTRFPDWTAERAFRRFCLTSRRPGERLTAGMPEGSGPHMLQTPDAVVATWTMPAPRPAGPKALLVHGWNSRSRHMLPVARALNAKGIDVVLLDLPGNGASSGRRLHIGKGLTAVDAAWRNHGPFDLFVGHSFGGQVILNAALGSAMCVPARRPKALALIAAPNSIPAMFRWFGQRIGLPVAAQEKLEYKVFSMIGYPLEFMVAADQLADVSMPVLVAHDMDDKDVLYSDALRMKRGGPSVQLYTTSGLGHRRILKDPGLHDRLAELVIPKPKTRAQGNDRWHLSA